MKTKTITFDQAGIISIDDNTANIFTIILGSFLIAVLAQISIPLPFTPIPITGQTIGVILVGGLLGARRGAMAVLTYLMEGAIGLPVFAQMKAGAHVLVGPTRCYRAPRFRPNESRRPRIGWTNGRLSLGICFCRFLDWLSC